MSVRSTGLSFLDEHPDDDLLAHNVTVLGQGPLTLLLVHGYGCNQAMWRSLAPALARRWRVVLLDLVGFGLSDFQAWQPARYGQGLIGHARDLLDVAQAFSDRPVVVVGHSVGAMIGLVAELANPRAFAAHAMVAPSPCFLNDGSYRGGFERSALEDLLQAQDTDMFSWSQLVAGLVMQQPGSPDLILELAQSFCNAYPPAAKALAKATFLGDHRAALALLRKPTLILQSAQDDLAPLSVGRYMQQQVPSSELQVLDTYGHCPHLIAPEQCLAALETFLLRYQSQMARAAVHVAEPSWTSPA